MKVSRIEKGTALSDCLPTVLLVDDDDDVRETSADMLGDLGYRVIQADSGQEALRLLQQHPELSVMVTDVRMPGMSGIELTTMAMRRHRHLRVILMSGYFVPQPISQRFLRKPFRTRDLHAAIQAEIGGSPLQDDVYING